MEFGVRLSAICCSLGVLFVSAIAVLHGSGFGRFTAEMNQSNASSFLKDMFQVLYTIPSLFLFTLAAFGVLAIFNEKVRRPICIILCPAVIASGATALLLGEWTPLVIMTLGGALFGIAAQTSSQSDIEIDTPDD